MLAKTHNRRAFLLAVTAPMVLVASGRKSLAFPPQPIFNTSSRMLLLSSIFAVPPNPCISTREAINLAGNVQVVTSFPPQPVTPTTVDLHLNMAGVQGTGQTSDSLYIGTGSVRLTNVAYPPEPLLANFTLEHTDGCASTTLPLVFNLQFDGVGRLLETSTVEIFTDS